MARPALHRLHSLTHPPGSLAHGSHYRYQWQLRRSVPLHFVLTRSVDCRSFESSPSLLITFFMLHLRPDLRRRTYLHLLDVARPRPSPATLRSLRFALAALLTTVVAFALFVRGVDAQCVAGCVSAQFVSAVAAGAGHCQCVRDSE